MKLSKAFKAGVDPEDVANNPIEKVDPVQIAGDFFSALYGMVEGESEGVVSAFMLPSNHAVFLDVGDREGLKRMLARYWSQNIYFSVGLMGEKKGIGEGRGLEADVSVVPGMWVDVDIASGVHKGSHLPEDVEHAVKALDMSFPHKPSITIHSGGGLHCYWLFDEPYLVEGDKQRLAFIASLSQRFQRHLKRSFRVLGLNLDSTFDLSRLLRIPGTINRKGGGAKPVKVLHGLEGEPVRFAVQDFLDVLELQEQAFHEQLDLGSPEDWQDKSSAGDTKDRAQERLADYDFLGSLDGGAKLQNAGGRNNALKMIVVSCLERGESLEKTLFEVLKHDARHHSPPLFKDITEQKTGHDYTNALRFISSVVSSINAQRETRGLDPQRFIFSDLEGSKTLIEQKDVAIFDPVSLMDEPFVDNSWLGDGLLAPGDFMLIAGPPKSQKSFLAQDLCVHLAMGWDWLGMKVASPCRIAYINMEMGKKTLIRRMKALPVGKQGGEEGEAERMHLRTHYKITEKHFMVLDDAGVSQLVTRIKGEMFREEGEMPDVIVIDPLVNVFPGQSENDNQEMMAFLKRLDAARNEINPEAALIVLHHSSKVSKKDMAENPFNAIRGAGALRGYYTSCMMIYREEVGADERRVMFECRDGRAPESCLVLYDEHEGKFVDAERIVRLAGQSVAQKWKLESDRQNRAIMMELERLALEERRLMTARSFSDVYAREMGFTGAKSIQRKLKELSARGYIRFNDGYDLPADIEAPHHRSDGYMIIEGLALGTPIDDAGSYDLTIVKPTHYKHVDSGVMMEVEDPDVWIYRDGQDVEKVEVKHAANRVRQYKLKEPRSYDVDGEEDRVKLGRMKPKKKEHVPY